MAIHSDKSDEADSYIAYYESGNPILPRHDIAWMPNRIADCPCDECQGHIDREAALDREAIWPWKLDWKVSVAKDGRPGTCPCGEYLETFQDYDMKGKTRKLTTAPHILVQVYGQMTLGDGIYFPGVTKVQLHLGCGSKPINPDQRSHWDMETRSRDVLLLESLSARAKSKIGLISEEQSKKEAK